MLEMAIYRAPRAPHPADRKPISPVARQHMDEALRLLNGDTPGLTGEDALAERERLRREDAARDAVQSELLLHCAPSPREATESTRGQGGELNLNEAASHSAPGDGSSWPTADAGNSDPVSLVDSAAGSY
ncbi:hypothetical protein KWH04_09800 [Xanthomonas campestris pv. trichodesmae]|uniref:Uncharacterized protein n=3 Tax=Xanthomonas TaxID=338 RepID=A0AB33CMH7_XANCI|nr:hypothetical protein XcvCFBP7111P_10340 [Xanthomonas citri pv. vignicola]MBV6780934.1 hypothetical protein [Xanthomonas campestris pv. trichodesmae]MBV6788458.1 hypothetical protein [Xanthomonas campestris pv. clerodendri]MBZ3919226.1 hypothetical protein [Xanthomonas campestris pv. trichodesmae]MBZ3922893.1 hypothetical protein [Xanthomonas citri pv. sesbaniae]